MEPTIATEPTRITIPARREESSSDASPVRRHQAGNYRGREIAGTEAEKQFFGEDGLQVSDILDVLNPLQHIPFVSTLYRELTGDAISPAAKLAGGALLGGPLGLVTAIADTVMTQETGKGLTETAVAAVTGADTVQVAQAAPKRTVSDAELVDQLYPEAVANAEQKIAAERYASLAQEQKQADIEILPPSSPLALTPASVSVPAAGGSMTTAMQSRAMLDLYGASPSPQHRAYRDANMLGYLQAASSVNTVM